MRVLAADGIYAEEAVEFVMGAQGGDGDVGMAVSHELVPGQPRLPPLAANDQEENEANHGQHESRYDEDEDSVTVSDSSRGGGGHLRGSGTL